MKLLTILVTVLCLSMATATVDLDKLYDTLKHVESRGNSNAIGSNRTTYGPVQMSKACVDDINKIYGTTYTHYEAFDDECAREMFKLYLEAGRKLYVSRHGTEPTHHDLVRMWNGGMYDGYRKKSTLKYLKKYLKHVDKI